jgi:hypothetical protein
MSPEEEKEKTKVTFMLDNDLYEWIVQRARKRRTNITTVVKDLILDGIDITKEFDEIKDSIRSRASKSKDQEA